MLGGNRGQRGAERLAIGHVTGDHRHRRPGRRQIGDQFGSPGRGETGTARDAPGAVRRDRPPGGGPRHRRDRPCRRSPARFRMPTSQADRLTVGPAATSSGHEVLAGADGDLGLVLGDRRTHRIARGHVVDGEQDHPARVLSLRRPDQPGRQRKSGHRPGVATTTRLSHDQAGRASQASQPRQGVRHGPVRGRHELVRRRPDTGERSPRHGPARVDSIVKAVPSRRTPRRTANTSSPTTTRSAHARLDQRPLDPVDPPRPCPPRTAAARGRRSDAYGGRASTPPACPRYRSTRSRPTRPGRAATWPAACRCRRGTAEPRSTRTAPAPPRPSSWSR